MLRKAIQEKKKLCNAIILRLSQTFSKTNSAELKKNLQTFFRVCYVSWKQRNLEIRANIRIVFNYLGKELSPNSTFFCRARKGLGTSLALQCYAAVFSVVTVQETKVNYSFSSFLYFVSPYLARLCAPCEHGKKKYNKDEKNWKVTTARSSNVRVSTFWATIGQLKSPEIMRAEARPFSSPEPTILLACGRNREALGATISGMRHRCRCAVSRITRIRLFPLLFQNGCSQSSRFLPQARRIVGSGDENAARRLKLVLRWEGWV